MKLRLFIFLTALLPALALAETDFKLPAEIAELFRHAGTTEYGTVYVGKGKEPNLQLREYVAGHWLELLDNFESIQTVGNTSYASIVTLGLLAEDLPPEQYVEFMDHYVDLYSQHRIPDRQFLLQLMGVGRKAYFMTVNAKHPKVRAILKKAQDVVPVDNVALQSAIASEISGEGDDMYYANKSDDEPPPQTMPGIKLKTPFESLIASSTHGIRRSIATDSVRESAAIPDQSSIRTSTLVAALKARPLKYGMILLALALLGLGIFQVARHRLLRWKQRR